MVFHRIVSDCVKGRWHAIHYNISDEGSGCFDTILSGFRGEFSFVMKSLTI